MSPGSQMRALTANRARPNSTTIAAGNRVERKNCTGWALSHPILAGWRWARGQPPAGGSQAWIPNPLPGPLGGCPGGLGVCPRGLGPRQGRRLQTLASGPGPAKVPT